MAFHRKDQARGSDDKPLSTALLQDLDDGADAAGAARGRAACWSFDPRNRPRWASYGRSVLPLVWRLSYGCTSLVVTVRGVCVTEDVTVGVWVRPASDLARAITEPVLTTATLSPSASRQEATLTLDATALAPYSYARQPAAREVALLLCLESSLDGGTPLTGSPTSWNRWAVTWHPSGSISDSIPAAVLVMSRTDVSSATVIDTPDGYPRAAQILRQSSTSHELYLYPPPGNTWVATSSAGYTDAGGVYALGALYLEEIRVREAAFAALPPRGYSLNAGQYPAAQAGRRLYAKSADIFAGRTCVYRLGTSATAEDPDQQDSSPPAHGTNSGTPSPGAWYAGDVVNGRATINPLGVELKIVSGSSTYDPDVPASPGDFVTLARATADRPRAYTDEDDGTTHTTSCVETLALVCVTTYSEGGIYGVRLRQGHTPPGGSASYGDPVAVECQASRHVNDDPYQDLAGYLAHWVAQPDSGAVIPQRLHALRGFVPQELFHLLGLQLVRLRDTYTGTETAARITIQGQVSDRPLDGGRLTSQATDRLLHLVAVTIMEAEGDVATELGS